MYEKLNITENHLNVLSLFTERLDKGYYTREVHKILSISPRTAQLVLANLENKGVLESKTRGKIKLYTVRKNDKSVRYFTLAEQYKTIKLFEKYPLIEEVMEKISPSIEGSAAIFGSYAKGNATKESDIDLLVVGKYNEKEVKKRAHMYGVVVSVTCYPEKIFEKRWAKDILLREVAKSHRILCRGERFVQVMVYG